MGKKEKYRRGTIPVQRQEHLAIPDFTTGVPKIIARHFADLPLLIASYNRAPNGSTNEMKARILAFEKIRKIYHEGFIPCVILHGEFLGGVGTEVEGMQFTGKMDSRTEGEHLRAVMSGLFDTFIVIRRSNGLPTGGTFLLGLARLRTDKPVEFVYEQSNIPGVKKTGQEENLKIVNGMIFTINGWK